MEIKVLGPGCANCKKLEDATRKAVEKAGLDATIAKVSDLQEIMGYGVMSTPALVVDGELRLAGRVPSVDDLVALLQRG
ncbi:MAG: TM0996/MTH895 family glutaredoxin-like protein [Coriobacteriales bacterium]|nr:TM0996/MTH895 family glutaredoxin-like protein [Coriobacteriales bacterium]